MVRPQRTILLLYLASFLLCALPARAAEQPQPTPQQQAFIDAVNKLDWVKGPTTVDVPGKSRLAVPQGYVFLDRSNTDKYLELTHNPPGGSEVMVAPSNLHWVAYLSFNEEGFVKDDEKIDAAELLAALQEATKAGNQERRRRGWAELQVVGWAVEPAYNPESKRLEWATTYESEGERGVNFSTKVLSRRGHTSAILVCDPGDLTAARSEFDALLGGYSFKEGERYADWVPGDKVATYGLAALVLGGAAAVAAKKGLFAALIGFIVAKIKLVIAGIVALGAAIRKFLFGKKTDDAG